ncbi:unnamed protein product [Protopolystoma xenopodis]|uniref:Uncharacterized protein n=1 Tax=Protopolystoma xenopodis TaxID=117903 RepID=A0A3S5CV21_9PLAT|nr:unnamed protein product [Protopolystoma xenopodis]
MPSLLRPVRTPNRVTFTCPSHQVVLRLARFMRAKCARIVYRTAHTLFRRLDGHTSAHRADKNNSNRTHEAESDGNVSIIPSNSTELGQTSSEETTSEDESDCTESEGGEGVSNEAAETGTEVEVEGEVEVEVETEAEGRYRCCLFCACFNACMPRRVPERLLSVSDAVYSTCQHSQAGCPEVCPTCVPRVGDEEWRRPREMAPQFACCRCCGQPDGIVCLRYLDMVCCLCCPLWDVIKGCDYGYRRFRVQMVLDRHNDAQKREYGGCV